MKKMMLLAGVAALGLSAPCAQATELRMVGAYAENFVTKIEIADRFAALVSEEAEGRISIAYTGPDAVPALEQFEPVRAGVFDLLFTHPAYHAGVTPVGLAIDAVKGDPTARREAGIIDYIDEFYRKHENMTLLSATVGGSVGFRYYLREPITGAPAFDGRRIRGTVSYHPMIEALGGSGVVISGGEVYSALQTGVVDGAAWSRNGAYDFKWYEVASYMAEPAFGQVGSMIFMNLESWDGLSEDDQAAIRRAVERLEPIVFERYDELADIERDKLIEHGMQVTHFSPEEAAKLNTLWSEGVWSVAMRNAPDAIAGLRELARKAGLSD